MVWGFLIGEGILFKILDQGQIYLVLCKIEFAVNQRETYGYVNTNKEYWWIFLDIGKWSPALLNC